MESFVKKILHLHLILLAVAATVVLCVDLNRHSRKVLTASESRVFGD